MDSLVHERFLSKEIWVPLISAIVSLLGAAKLGLDWKRDYEFYKKNGWNFELDSGRKLSFGFANRPRLVTNKQRHDWRYPTAVATLLVIGFVSLGVLIFG